MKAIVVAAGLGSRMNNLTKERPKCSLPVDGLSIFDHQLRALRSAGVSDISVVVGHGASFFEGYPDVKKYVNENYRENNILFSLMCARAELDSDVLICYSDIIYDDDALHGLFPLEAAFTAVTDLDWRESYVGRTDHPESQAENVRISGGTIESIGKHLQPEESSAEFIGIFALSTEGCAIWNKTFDDIRRSSAGGPFQQAARLEMAYLTDMAQELIDRGFSVKPHLIRGGWMEIDTEQDYLAANKKFRE